MANFVTTQAVVQGAKQSNNIAIINTTKNNAPTLYNQGSSIIDPTVDQLWGGMFDAGQINPYVTYFFSGQDMNITIDGCAGDATYGDLPINNFSFTVQQQKMPLYGYNSFVYDAIARGSRIITGSFVLVSRSPDYFMQALALAAYNRYNNKSTLNSNYTPPLSEDDQNLLTYWGNNLDPSLTPGNYNLFSTHPPFTFVIQYGIQDISTTSTTSYSTAAAELQSQYKNLSANDMLALDINDRLVQPDPSLPEFMVFLLDSCELTSMQTAYDTTGKPIGEAYSFIAHDIIYPPPAASTQNLF